MATYRLIAPRHLAPSVVELSGGTQLHLPPSGVVEIPDVDDYPGSCMQPIENVDGPPMRINRTYLRELLALGFQHVPAAGGVAERPAGRYAGEMWFCTFTGRQLWWSNGAWRDAAGRGA